VIKNLKYKNLMKKTPHGKRNKTSLSKKIGDYHGMNSKNK
jgi:hypothetical protein